MRTTRGVKNPKVFADVLYDWSLVERQPVSPGALVVGVAHLMRVLSRDGGGGVAQLHLQGAQFNTLKNVRQIFKKKFTKPKVEIETCTKY